MLITATCILYNMYMYMYNTCTCLVIHVLSVLIRYKQTEPARFMLITINGLCYRIQSHVITWLYCYYYYKHTHSLEILPLHS